MAERKDSCQQPTACALRRGRSHVRTTTFSCSPPGGLGVIGMAANPAQCSAAAHIACRRLQPHGLTPCATPNCGLTPQTIPVRLPGSHALQTTGWQSHYGRQEWEARVHRSSSCSQAALQPLWQQTKAAGRQAKSIRKQGASSSGLQTTSGTAHRLYAAPLPWTLPGRCISSSCTWLACACAAFSAGRDICRPYMGFR